MNALKVYAFFGVCLMAALFTLTSAGPWPPPKRPGTLYIPSTTPYSTPKRIKDLPTRGPNGSPAPSLQRFRYRSRYG
ncbi:hypothetical protein OESDEN_07170 [Oesophagostomum dentatum]|uniref:Uncharacterized protein n=1 Tax=Oesophagostomum dentatum TaxID=61180 RepID=A0A0B1T6R0_OESDE|nr:hypothetical protein OESDEN_07170 [Oesophagostomum dentatum]